ncbi:MAG: DNA/RNA nuclease SfsA [Caulobacteraceae bacterium]
MRLPPLHRGTLLRRYKRFLADIAFDDGHEETVHVPNPGSMMGLADPGLTVWTSRSEAKARKLPHTLELVQVEDAFVGVNTMLPNRLVAEALAQGAIPELAGCGVVRAEVKYGEKSRVDFLLEEPTPGSAGRTWVEVKSVTLSRQRGLAEWPDCVSSRSVQHLRELGAQRANGDRAVLLFVVQRTDCDRFAPAADLDPAFAAALATAIAGGLEVLVYGCDMTLEGITIRRSLPSIRI